MPRRWEFLQATPRERAGLPSAAALAALPGEPAAPANRHRAVARVLFEGRSYYWKRFGPASFGNRWRFRTSAPPAQDDAEREALVTLALKEQGIETPRPLLRGSDDDGSSHYVCAELPGRSLHRWLREGPPAPAMVLLCAAFCGDVLKKGIWLPDLSAEHVFVRQEIAFFHFGLLDLHNGTLARPGPPPLWLCRRVLRHFQRSVQDLPLPRQLLLRFALRLLKNAGRMPAARALLRQLPPVDTALRYDRDKAADYRTRNPARTARELRLLARVWPGRRGELVADVPCGTGRLLPFLLEHHHRVVQIDRSAAMLAEARQLSGQQALLAHALSLPLRDRAVDGVVMFRFLHHLERSAQKQALAEACRIARRFVVVSFFHPCSVHHWQRQLRALLLRRAATRHAVTLGDLRRWGAGHGFLCLRRAADLPFAKDLWLAVLERRLP